MLSQVLCNLFSPYLLTLQVSSSSGTTISQPILQLSADTQTQVSQVAQGQDLNAAAGQTLQSVQLVNPGTFLIQAQTVTATGQIQWQTFQVTSEQHAGRLFPLGVSCGFMHSFCISRSRGSSHSRDSSCLRGRGRPSN